MFVTEIDDEHKEIFAAVADLRHALSRHDPSVDTRQLTQHLTVCIVDHFAHEERLMRAARYTSLRWHKLQHDNARRRVERFVGELQNGDANAGLALVEYLTAWLRDHTRLADRMMGAFLRNQRRICQVTFRAGSRPLDACEWVDAGGKRFDPVTE